MPSPFVRRSKVGQSPLQVGDIGPYADRAATRYLAFRDQRPAFVRQLTFHGSVVLQMPGGRRRHEALDVIPGPRILAALHPTADDVFEAGARVDEVTTQLIDMAELLVAQH